MRKQLVFFDTETTGLDPKTCRIIELAAQTTDWKMDHFICLEKGQHIPEKIIELTGITDDMLKKYGKSEEDVLAEFMSHVGRDTILVAHNAQFDLGFLYEAIKRHPNHPEWEEKYHAADYLDTLTVFQDRRCYPHKLSDAIAAYGLTEECKNSHRAIDDTYALSRVFQKLREERDDLIEYINVFGEHPKHGVNGNRIPKVHYVRYSYRNTDLVPPNQILPKKAG